MEDFEKTGNLEKTEGNSKSSFASKSIRGLALLFGSGFLLAGVGWFFSCQELDIEKEKLAFEKERHEQLKADYEKSRHSELFLSYVTEVGEDKPRIHIRNGGNGFADSIWLSQKFYLVDSSNSVFECDLPRYKYMLFNGSERKMFSLMPNDDTSLVFWPDCFLHFWSILKSKYSGKLVMRWQLEFNDENNLSRQTKFFCFLLDDFYRPLRPIEETGGTGLVEKVEWYERNSIRRHIKWVSQFSEFFLNPKPDFYIDDEGEWQFLPANADSLNIVERVLSLGPEDLRPMHNAGYGAIIWSCDKGELAKGLMSSATPVY